MAVLALGFAGTAIGSSIGGTILGVSAATIGGYIGASIGSMIDNQAMKQVGGPKLSDLTVQTSTYGSAIPIAFGPENRMAGNVIWLANNKLNEHKHKGGKKKGASNAIATGSLSLLGGSASTGLGMAVISGGLTFLKNSKTPSGYTYTASFAVAFADSRIRPGVGITRIYLNGKLEWTNEGGVKDSKLWQSFQFYTGTKDQNPDPVIESYLGMGKTPAYRGTAYIRFEELQLADFGNGLPTVEIVYEADTEISVRGVLQRIVEMSGIDHNQAGTASVTGNVRGFTIGSDSMATAAIQPIALAYDFDAAEVAGQARFFARGLGPAAVIPSKDLGARGVGEDLNPPLQWSRAPETDLPKSATISFMDPARDYQPNSSTSSRKQGSAQSNLSSEVAIVMDPDTGKKISDRMLWEAWNARSSVGAQASDRWLSAEAGRVYLFETPAGLEPLRLKKKTRGANGVIELSCVRDRAEVYKTTQHGTAAPIPPQEVSEPAKTKMVVLDTSILRDIDDDFGFYWSVTETAPGWRGASMMVSADGDEYDTFGYTGYQNVIGSASILADGVTDVIDNENTLRVTLFDPDGALTPVAEDDMIAGANVAWIGPASGEGGEIIQFKTPTIVSPGVYDLTGLLRGRLGTEYATALHGANELFVILDFAVVSRLNYNRKDWDVPLIYKAVTLLTDIADADPVPFTNTGEGKRCLSPVHVLGVKDQDTGDMVVTWIRRSRIRSLGIGNGDLPLGEAEETYEIDVYKGAVFKRTLTATTPTITHTAAQLATDGFAGGNTITYNVYQTNEPRGRGHVGVGKVVL